MRRLTQWWNKGQGFQSGSPPSSDPCAAPDFLAQTVNPDDPRIHSREETQRASAEFRSLEDDWRQQCRHFASTQDLSHVQQMHIAHIIYATRIVTCTACIQVPDAHDRKGNLLGIVIGAHYRTKAISREELLLHVVQEMQKVGGKLFSIVYLHADVHLPAVPDTTFMQQLHAGLDPSHKRQLQDIYVVHASWALRAWILALRLRLPEIYGKVTYVDRLSTLIQFIAPDELGQLPQHVMEADEWRADR